jgi:Zn-dependent M28 family amino/carboxypeptidase
VKPLPSIVANINIDMIGRNWADTIVAIGREHSDLGQTLARVNAAHPELNMTAIDDKWPEERFYFRSDHFPFVKEGVPALNADGGSEYIGKPAGFGQKIRDEYTTNDYHKPSDVIKPDWDLGGTVEDLQLLWMIGWDVANSDHHPQWKPGVEFKR